MSEGKAEEMDWKGEGRGDELNVAWPSGLIRRNNTLDVSPLLTAASCTAKPEPLRRVRRARTR